MGKSHKTGHHSKKPDSAKKKDNKEKDKSNKEKKVVVKGGDGKLKNIQKSPKSAKKKGGDGKSDKNKKQADKGNNKHHNKPKSGKEKEKSGKEKEKSGKEKTSKPPPKKEDQLEFTSTADEAEVEVEVTKPPPKVAVKGSPKKAVEETSEADTCESKSSNGQQQSSAGAAADASLAADDPEMTATAADSSEATNTTTSTEETSDEQPAKAEKKHKSKKPKGEKEKKPKSTKNSSPKMEFTKPTINQMVREEERLKHPKPPLVDTPLITRYEFEAFNDEVEEMNSSLQMLRNSYGSIITSLVAMYTKRGKRGQKAQLPPTVDGKANLLTPINAAAGAGEVQEEASILNDADKYNIENFINPATRQASFDALFAEVELLNRKTEKFRTAFFDKKGYFLQEKYDGQKEMKLSRKKLNHFWLWTRKLTEVIDEIARNYNDDLLNMFRLH